MDYKPIYLVMALAVATKKSKSSPGICLVMDGYGAFRLESENVLLHPWI